MTLIRVTKATLPPMEFDNHGRPIFRVFGTAGDDTITINVPQQYYRGQAIPIAVFAGPGDDTIFSTPGVNPSFVKYYADWGTGSQGTVFPWATTGRFENAVHVGSGALVNNAGRSADTIFLHGGHYDKRATVSRFDLRDDTIVAEASEGWEVDAFRFKTISSGGGEWRGRLERVDLSFADDNPILDGQTLRVKFLDGRLPLIVGDRGESRDDALDDWVAHLVADDVLSL